MFPALRCSCHSDIEDRLCLNRFISCDSESVRVYTQIWNKIIKASAVRWHNHPNPDWEISRVLHQIKTDRDKRTWWRINLMTQTDSFITAERSSHLTSVRTDAGFVWIWRVVLRSLCHTLILWNFIRREIKTHTTVQSSKIKDIVQKLKLWHHLLTLMSCTTLFCKPKIWIIYKYPG